MAEQFNIDYEKATDYANEISSISESVNDVFNAMTGIFNDLTSVAWKSAEADEVANMFNNEIKPKYPIYVENIKNASNTVLKDIESYRTGDQAANQTMQG